jgi:hypothetical protein
MKLSEIYREFYKIFDKTLADLSNDLKKQMKFDSILYKEVRQYGTGKLS